MASPKLVTVFGGSGFLGRYVVGALTKQGYRVRVAVRRPDLAFHLKPLGDVGQIQLVQANLRYPKSVDAACVGADVVINLVGILFESGKQKFDTVQHMGAANVARSAASVGAKLIHMSALGADEDSPSRYARTKAKAEQAVRDIDKNAIIFQPSIIFGQEDDFFNRFAKMARISPVLPLINGGKTKFQPVYVNDVANAVALAANGELKKGKTYQLGGPEVVSFKDVLETIQEITCRDRLMLPVPNFVAKFMAFFLEFLPSPALTRDQITLLQEDNVVSDGAKKKGLTLEKIGIIPTNATAILPSYLEQYRPHGQYKEQSPA